MLDLTNSMHYVLGINDKCNWLPNNENNRILLSISELMTASGV